MKGKTFQASAKKLEVLERGESLNLKLIATNKISITEETI